MMKNLFPGHFKNSDDEISKIWDKALFVFDANIILNLYRYSDKSRAEFLDLLKSIQDRIWMPHRAVDEYLSNRASTIQGQEKAYDSTITETKNLVQKLENTKQHPFVSPETLTKIKDAFSTLETELSSGKSVHTKRLHQDEIKVAIGEIFTEAVGPPYDDNQLAEICTEGENRYEDNIPPGYKDDAKGRNGTTRQDRYRKFGDLIVWKQIIEKSKTDKTDIIFVTDDKKEDWWELHSGKTLGPRPELIKEFAEATSQQFLMYTADRFLTLSKDKLQGSVSDELVQETRDLHTNQNDTIYPSTLADKNYETNHNKISTLRESQQGLAELLRAHESSTETLRKAAHPDNSDILSALFTESPIKKAMKDLGISSNNMFVTNDQLKDILNR